MVAWMAIAGGVGGAVMLADFVYHRFIEDKPVKKTPGVEVQIPHAEAGVPIGMIFGKCRVRRPILVWHSTPRYSAPSFDINMMFVLGIPMDDGAGTNSVHRFWSGDHESIWSVVGNGLVGDGGPDGLISIIGTGRNGEDLGTGIMEYLNGKITQVLVNDGENDTNAWTHAGRHMLSSSLPGGGGLSENDIPGYRGYVCAFLYGSSPGGSLQFRFGSSPTIPGFSFEVSSYQTGNGFPGVGIQGQIGEDSNPANALYCLLKSKHGKAGIDAATYIDTTTFGAAAAALHQESHGFSQYIDNSATLDEHITSILKQIDGVLYADESDSKYKLKLIRPDYVIRDLPAINRDTAVDLINLSVGGWTDIANQISVTFVDRDRGYADNTIVEQSTAAQYEGIINEVSLRFPGVSNVALATRIAQRELAARSRPLIKCRAILDRSFVRLNPGDAVVVNWSKPDIGGLVFRVASIDRGTPADPRIQADLIQDFSYTYKQIAPLPPGLDRGGFGPGELGDLL